MPFENLRDKRLLAEQQQAAAEQAEKMQRLQWVEREINNKRDKHSKIVAALRSYGVRNIVALMNEFKIAVDSKSNVSCVGSYLFVSRDLTEQHPSGRNEDVSIYGVDVIEAVIDNKNVLKILEKSVSSYGYSQVRNLITERQSWEILFSSVNISLQRESLQVGSGDSGTTIDVGIMIAIDEYGIYVNGYSVENFQQLEALIEKIETDRDYKELFR